MKMIIELMSKFDLKLYLFLQLQVACFHFKYFSCTIFKRDVCLKISVYISEMRYYVHYLHFSDYCPHLCRHVYHIVWVVVLSGLLRVVGMSNLTLYFANRGSLFNYPYSMGVSYQLSPVNFSSECPPLPSPGIELTVFECITGPN